MAAASDLRVQVDTTIRIWDEQGVEQDPLDYTYNKTGLKRLHQQTVKVAAAGTLALWDPTVWTGVNLSDFDFLAIVAIDGDLELEEVCNKGDVNEELHNVTLVAQLPRMLGSNVSRYNHGANDSFAGVADVIDRLRLKNNGASAVTAKLILMNDTA